jgi:hypothetical protein
MNFELAVMALEGLARDPARMKVDGAEVVIEATPASFRELARILLLLGGSPPDSGEAFELQPARHLTPESPLLRLRLVPSQLS